MLNDPTGSCLPCGLYRPIRNAYFDGKFLLAEDFNLQSDYHRGQQQLHNSLLHGTGTVCGLKLVEHPSPGCQREYLVLEPGMAIDCCGRQIVVPERTLVRVAERLAEDPDLAAQLDGSRHLVIGLKACDHGVDPVPAILPGCKDPGEPAEFGRIAEDFELSLAAVDPSESRAPQAPTVPKLSWAHTIALGGQLPRAVHDNAAEGMLQLAVDSLAGGSHLYLYGRTAHDLRAVLEGPESLHATASMREARLLLAAGSGFGESAAAGVGFWRAESAAGAGAPAGILAQDAALLRLAVSPVSGLLTILALRDDEHTVLSAYAPNDILTWLDGGGASEDAPAPLGSLDFGHGFGGDQGPAARGAGMLRFSHDGRFLAVAAPAAAGETHFYLVEIAALNAGSLTREQAIPAGMPVGTDTVAMDWSLDDAYLYVLANEPAGDGPGMSLHRYALTGNGTEVERKGRGVLLAGTARDLAIAPTETRAHLLLQDAGGITRLGTVDIERVKSVSEPDPEEVLLSADAIRIDGDGRSLELAANGARLYVAAGDADPESPPSRGLVAVIGIEEDDCGVHLDRQLDGCAQCAGEQAGGCGCHGPAPRVDDAVVLGHLPNYVAADAPRMLDADHALDGDAAIDNFSLRSILPSAQTLLEIIRCMLDRGIDAGPPGPRGDPGRDGVDGEDGQDGEDGAGIDEATLEYVPELDEPQVQIIVDDAGQRVLDIDLPEPEAAQPPEVNRIIAASWIHGQEYEPLSGDFGKDLRERGIAVAFEHPVVFTPFAVDQEVKRNMLAYMQRRVGLDNDTYTWANIARVEPVALGADPVIDGNLLQDWTLEPGAEISSGLALVASDVSFAAGEVYRVEFYADFILDEEGRPLAGAHLGGQLPTGGSPGGTFRSWFTSPFIIDPEAVESPAGKGKK